MHFPARLVRPWLSVFVLVLAIILLVERSHTARSQPSIAEGTFVMDKDGNGWVVGNGRRSLIAFRAGEDVQELLASLPVGPRVTTVDEARAALASASVPIQPLLDVMLSTQGERAEFDGQGRIEVCWEITPSGANVSLLLLEEGQSDPVEGRIFVSLSASGCRPLDLSRAGRFTIVVDRVFDIAGPLQHVRVTVRPVP